MRGFPEEKLTESIEEAEEASSAGGDREAAGFPAVAMAGDEPSAKRKGKQRKRGVFESFPERDLHENYTAPTDLPENGPTCPVTRRERPQQCGWR